MSNTGRYFLTFVALFTPIGSFLADFNNTHIWNPTWTNHAVFHTGQTLSMSIFLGLATLYYTWRSHPTDPLDSIFTAAVFGSAYWCTQFAAYWYPNSKPGDPPGDTETFYQLVPICISLGCVGVGYTLQKREILRRKVK